MTAEQMNEMHNEPSTVQELAAAAYGWFEVAYRVEGDSDTRYIRMKDGVPGWVEAVTFAGHDAGGMFPDDWRYECIQDALEAISDGSDGDNDGAHEFADGKVDVYTHNRLLWLSSHLSRPGYVDQAREEGLVSDDTDLIFHIGVGQYMEALEVFGQVYRALEERLEELEEEREEEGEKS